MYVCASSCGWFRACRCSVPTLWARFVRQETSLMHLFIADKTDFLVLLFSNGFSAPRTVFECGVWTRPFLFVQCNVVLVEEEVANIAVNGCGFDDFFFAISTK